MTEKDKMHIGELYLPDDKEIMEWQTKCFDRLYDFNNTRPTDSEKRQALLKEMFAEIGEGCYIEPPLHSNFGGGHCHFGNFVYANFGLRVGQLYSRQSADTLGDVGAGGLSHTFCPKPLAQRS